MLMNCCKNVVTSKEVHFKKINYRLIVIGAGLETVIHGVTCYHYLKLFFIQYCARPSNAGQLVYNNNYNLLLENKFFSIWKV